ncbi:MAG: hypothetical protein LIR46_05065 [Bacteroidota bacterium]|nr:hypothetical protein [Bacteroidota bacterium]
MKWGVRRYQNKDGTRTSLGKERYRKGGALYKSSNTDTPKEGVKNAPRRLAEGIVRGVKQKLAEKMPYFLNDEELQRYTDRQRAENAYLQSRGDKRIAKNRGKNENYGVTLLKNAANKAIGITVDKTINKAMDRALETADERALREAKTRQMRYSEESNKTKNRLSKLISENDEANQSDYQRMQRIRKNQLENHMYNPKAAKRDSEKTKQLLENIRKRTEENNMAKAVLKSPTFKNSQNSGISKEELQKMINEIIQKNKE